MTDLPSRNFCSNFNTSIFDICTLPGTQSRTLHWVDDPTSRCITNRRASCRITRQIEWLIRSNCSTRIGNRRRGIRKALSDIERATRNIIHETVDDGIFTNAVGC